ncbi:MAG: protein kinase [Betaproteobacteria bacterium]|nr:protein kinase [Betaproteobacteria bacterium]
MTAAAPKILVVDDDAAMREFMRWCLGPLRPQLIEAADGLEALAVMRRDAPDLVISDVHMPRLNGFELVSAVKADSALQSIPFLMMSSLEDRAAYRRAFGLGVCDFIIKPLAREDVIGSVKRVLEQRRATRGEVAWAVPGYEMIRPLGEGATGEVHLARRLADGRECALKLMRLKADDTESRDTIARFLDEARLLASIRHRHVARILDHGVTDTCLYIAMEYFPGGDLRAALKTRPAARQALDYARQIGEGLAAIHAAGIVHRDLKPGNIMVRGDGSIAIADFGLAKQLDALITRTREGMAMGTPLYMSPEQISGERPDGRADLYSLGVMLYEMLTGMPLFEAGNVDGLLVQHLHAERPRLAEDSSAAILQPLLDKLIARAREDRFAGAEDFLSMLAFAAAVRFMDEPVRADPEEPGVIDWHLETPPPFFDPAATSTATSCNA